jgi:hypothetical protein
MTNIQFKNPQSFTYNDNNDVDHCTRATIKRYIQYVELNHKCRIERIVNTDVYIIYVNDKHIWDFNPFKVEGSEMSIAIQKIEDEHLMNSYNC